MTKIIQPEPFKRLVLVAVKDLDFKVSGDWEKIKDQFQGHELQVIWPRNFYENK